MLCCVAQQPCLSRQITPFWVPIKNFYIWLKRGCRALVFVECKTTLQFFFNRYALISKTFLFLDLFVCKFSLFLKNFSWFFIKCLLCGNSIQRTHQEHAPNRNPAGGKRVNLVMFKLFLGYYTITLIQRN